MDCEVCGHAISNFRVRAGETTCFACEEKAEQLAMDEATANAKAMVERVRGRKLELQHKCEEKLMPRGKRVTPETKDCIAALCREGKPMMEIVRLSGSSWETARAVLKERGLTPQPTRKGPAPRCEKPANIISEKVTPPVTSTPDTASPATPTAVEAAFPTPGAPEPNPPSVATEPPALRVSAPTGRDENTKRETDQSLTHEATTAARYAEEATPGGPDHALDRESEAPTQGLPANSDRLSPPHIHSYPWPPCIETAAGVPDALYDPLEPESGFDRAHARVIKTWRDLETCRTAIKRAEAAYLEACEALTECGRVA